CAHLVATAAHARHGSVPGVYFTQAFPWVCESWRHRVSWAAAGPSGEHAVKRQTASARLRRAGVPVVESLEGRQLLAGDPLAFQNVVQPLPYALDFTHQVNGVFDASGQMTGFTRVMANKPGNQYQPNLINLNTAVGELDITTTGTATS